MIMDSPDTIYSVTVDGKRYSYNIPYEREME